MWPNPRVPYQMACDRPRLEPLNGKPLMVHVVMNVEYWPFDRPMPRGIIPAPHGVTPAPPDIPNYSWVEYGMRVGFWRIKKILDQAKIRATLALNGSVCEAYPQVVQAALETLTRTRTSLIIAHRLSTVERADRILVLDEGRLVESGSHAELLANSSLYAELYRHQFQDADGPQ